MCTTELPRRREEVAGQVETLSCLHPFVSSKSANVPLTARTMASFSYRTGRVGSRRYIPLAIGSRSERPVVFSLCAYAAPSVKAEASVVFSNRLAAVSGRAHAMDFHDGVIEPLASYFSPTFWLLTQSTVGPATNLGPFSSPELQPSEHFWPRTIEHLANSRFDRGPHSRRSLATVFLPNNETSVAIWPAASGLRPRRVDRVSPAAC